VRTTEAELGQQSLMGVRIRPGEANWGQGQSWYGQAGPPCQTVGPAQWGSQQAGLWGDGDQPCCGAAGAKTDSMP